MQIKEYFKINRCKNHFMELINKVLKSKRAFWTDYLIGFKEMDIFISKAQALASQIESFQLYIEKKNQEKTCKMITLKALNSIFRNELRTAMKFEEEYQKFFTNELVKMENEKDKLSFMDKNIVICEASFLTYEGI